MSEENGNKVEVKEPENMEKLSKFGVTRGRQNPQKTRAPEFTLSQSKVDPMSTPNKAIFSAL